VTSLGDFGAELMTKAGKPLDAWQADALNVMCSVGPMGTWACVEYVEMCPRQNGKGGILEARVLLGFLSLKEKLILWSAHEYKAALEAFERIRELLFALGCKINDYLVEVPSDDGVIPIKINTAHGKEGFRRLDTNQRIKFIARSKGSGRSMSGDLVIIDEAYAYTVEQQEAQTPVILARPNPQIIYTSSPPLSGETGDALYSLRERAEEKDPTLGYRDWGIGGTLEELEKIDLDDQALWAAANPGVHVGRLTFAKIKVVKQAMRASRGRGFARECLGVWPRRKKGVGILDLVKWGKLGDPDSRRQGDVALAIDIAPDRSYAAIGLYALRADGLGHMRVIDYRPGTAWLVPRLVELRLALSPLVIVAGKATAKSMNTELEAAEFLPPDNLTEPPRGCLWVVSYLEMTAATGRLIDKVNEGTFRHCDQDILTDAATIAKTRTSGDTVTWVRKSDDGDVTPLTVGGLAMWGFEDVGPRVVLSEYDLLDSIG
jgi:hypothetical protein